MVFKGLSEKVRNSSSPLERLRQQVDEVVSGHRGDITSYCRERRIPLAQSLSQDDEALERVFRVLYEFLPAPIRLATGEERFIDYCFKHRERLLRRLLATEATTAG